MKQMTTPSVLAAAALAAVSPLALAASPDQEARIAELQAKVAALEARQASDSKDVAATIDRVLRDAERRSQLLAADGAGASAGYDNGFYIRLGDGWVLRPGIFFQFRNVTNYRDGGDDGGGEGGGDDDDETIDNGFEVRRLKLELAGNAFTKDLEYFFAWNTQTNGGSFVLEDAWVKYMFAADWGFRVGQFKDPLTKEWTTHDGRGLAVERSLLDATLGGAGNVNRTQGASLIYGGLAKDNPVNVEVVLHDGAGQLNTDFTEGAWDFGLAARADLKLMGDWAAYRDMTAKGTKERLLVVGAGVDWSQSGDGDQITGAVDLQYETAGGLSAYAALIVRDRDEDLAVNGDSTDWGGVVQLGYLLSPAWELFGRWSFIDFDNPAVAQADGEDFINEFTVGVNYYLGTDGSALHRAKVTIDLTYLPDGSPGPRLGLNYADDTNGEDEWVVRGQFQLWI